MTTIPSFSAKDWIDTNCRGGHALRPESVAVVSSFTLMWNIFEGAVCRPDEKFDYELLEKLAKKIDQHGLPLPDIKCGVQFWRQRYVIAGTLNIRFQGLLFRSEKQRKHVEAVLLSEKNDPESQLLAVMLVIYRLRNNLFHGLKQIDELNDQIQSLTMACRVLAAIVEVSWAHMIKQAA